MMLWVGGGVARIDGAGGKEWRVEIRVREWRVEFRVRYFQRENLGGRYKGNENIERELKIRQNMGRNWRLATGLSIFTE